MAKVRGRRAPYINCRSARSAMLTKSRRRFGFRQPTSNASRATPPDNGPERRRHRPATPTNLARVHATGMNEAGTPPSPTVLRQASERHGMNGSLRYSRPTQRIVIIYRSLRYVRPKQDHFTAGVMGKHVQQHGANRRIAVRWR